MADVMPDYHLEQQKLRYEIAQHRARIEGYKLEIIEVESRKGHAKNNIEATEKAIVDAEGRLKSLEETHGIKQVT